MDGFSCRDTCRCRKFDFSQYFCFYQRSPAQILKKTKKKWVLAHLTCTVPGRPRALFNMHTDVSVLFSLCFIISFRFHSLFLLVFPLFYFFPCLGEVWKKPRAGRALLFSWSSLSLCALCSTLHKHGYVHAVHILYVRALKQPSAPTHPPLSPCTVAAGLTLRNAVKQVLSLTISA